MDHYLLFKIINTPDPIPTHELLSHILQFGTLDHKAPITEAHQILDNIRITLMDEK